MFVSILSPYLINPALLVTLLYFIKHLQFTLDNYILIFSCVCKCSKFALLTSKHFNLILLNLLKCFALQTYKEKALTYKVCVCHFQTQSVTCVFLVSNFCQNFQLTLPLTFNTSLVKVLIKSFKVLMGNSGIISRFKSTIQNIFVEKIKVKVEACLSISKLSQLNIVCPLVLKYLRGEWIYYLQ